MEFTIDNTEDVGRYALGTSIILILFRYLPTGQYFIAIPGENGYDLTDAASARTLLDSIDADIAAHTALVNDQNAGESHDN